MLRHQQTHQLRTDATPLSAYERARLEIAAALEELQAAVVAALEEVGEAWNELDR